MYNVYLSKSANTRLNFPGNANYKDRLFIRCKTVLKLIRSLLMCQSLTVVRIMCFTSSFFQFLRVLDFLTGIA